MIGLLATAAAAGSVGASVGFVLASLRSERARAEAEVDRDLTHGDAAAAQDMATLLAIENLRLRGEITPGMCIPSPWPEGCLVDVQRAVPAAALAFAIPGPRVPQ